MVRRIKFDGMWSDMNGRHYKTQSTFSADSRIRSCTETETLADEDSSEGDENENTLFTNENDAEYNRPRKGNSFADVVTNVMKSKARNQLKDRRGISRITLRRKLRKLSENRLTIRQIISRYVRTSTLHGFRYAVMETFPVRRILWAMLMLTGCVYFIFKLKDGILEYYKFPYSEKTTIEMVENLEFPAISICPINQFDESKVEKSPLNRLYEEGRLPLHQNWSQPTYNIEGEELIQSILNTSFSIDDLFMDCDYIRRDTENPGIPFRRCSARNFTTYISEKGQVCHTLNSGKEGHEKLQITRAGMKNGFEMVLDVHNEKSIKLHPYTGVEVLLHHPTEASHFSTGFIVTTGFNTYVEMSKTQTENLPPMYSTMCGEKKLKYHKVYNQRTCVLEIVTDYVVQVCGCRDVFMPDNGAPYCSLLQLTGCVYPAKEAFDKNHAIAQCPLDCQVTSYEAKRTESRYLHNPVNGFEPTLVLMKQTNKNKSTSHLLELRKKMSLEQFDRYIEQNIIVVMFYYKEMEMTVNKLSAMFTFYNFLGSTGGAFQLMLGASLMTFIEFIDLFALLVYNQCLRLYKRKSGGNSRKPGAIEVEELLEN